MNTNKIFKKLNLDIYRTDLHPKRKAIVRFIQKHRTYKTIKVKISFDITRFSYNPITLDYKKL